MKLFEIFEDENGKLSMSRTLTFFTCTTIVGLFVIISCINKKIEIDINAVILFSIAFGGKLGSDYIKMKTIGK